MPHLTQIALLDFESTDNLYLLPGKVIWYGISSLKKEIVFRVWDFRVNHSTSFSRTYPLVDPKYISLFPKALKFASYTLVAR